MGRALLVLLALLFLVGPWLGRASHPAGPIALVILVLTIGVVFAIVAVRAWRSGRWKAQRRPVRWLIGTGYAGLIALGAYGLWTLYVDNFGPWIAAALLLGPALHGLLQGISGDRSAR